MIGQQCFAERQRIRARGMRQLVDEALDHECVLRVSHRAPEADRHARVVQEEFHAHTVDCVGQLFGALGAGRIAPAKECTARAPGNADSGIGYPAGQQGTEKIPRHRRNDARPHDPVLPAA